MNVIENEVNRLKCEVPQLNNFSNYLLFGIVCYKFFYNYGHYDYIEHKNCYTDGSNDGGIDLIAVNETELSKSLVLIQSKDINSFNSKDEIKDIFLKMAQTVRDFKNDRTSSYNEKLKRIYPEKYDDTCDDQDFSIELVLFIGTELTDKFKEGVDYLLNRTEELNDFELKIYTNNELEQQIKSITEGQRYVPQGRIDFYNKHGVIKYKENGILVDIKALSLRNLFDRYKNQGLFEQNFRYFVKHLKIDEQIKNSLDTKRDEFWFLNNGIIIGCQDFEVNGNNIKLTNFSIINGCQTTTILGLYKGQNENLDFPITCKIVKPNTLDDDHYDNFISEIAEASNSQKPISDRDLKSNKKEQRNLKNFLKEKDPKIYLEIKRGEKSNRSKNISSWQKIKNDNLGQLILSILLQQPGTARSSKKKIFADKAIYNSIYKNRTLDDDFKKCIVDILLLSNFYDKFIKSQTESFKEIPLNVAKNGKLCILAIIGFILKNERGFIDKSTNQNSKEFASELKRNNLTGALFDPSRSDDFELSLNSIFNELIQSVASLYRLRLDEESSVTNFLKTDFKYYSIILDHINTHFIQDAYEYKKLKEKLNNVFYLKN